MVTRGENEVKMSDIAFTRMTFPEKCKTNGWLMKLKKALYKTKTNVDIFSFLVSLKAGRDKLFLFPGLLSSSLLKESLIILDRQTCPRPRSLLEASLMPRSGS